MAKEKNKTKLQGYMLSPYYGTEPPPETNIRYSRPPKSLGKTDVQSMNNQNEPIKGIGPLFWRVYRNKVLQGDRSPVTREDLYPSEGRKLDRNVTRVFTKKSRKWRTVYK